jgi:hypothetical protein
MASALVSKSEPAIRCGRRRLAPVLPSSVSSVEWSSFTRYSVLPVMALARRVSPVMRSLLVGLTLMSVALTAAKVQS